jgi:hypothetical protein
MSLVRVRVGEPKTTRGYGANRNLFFVSPAFTRRLNSYCPLQPTSAPSASRPAAANPDALPPTRHLQLHYQKTDASCFASLVKNKSFPLSRFPAFPLSRFPAFPLSRPYPRRIIDVSSFPRSRTLPRILSLPQSSHRQNLCSIGRRSKGALMVARRQRAPDRWARPSTAGI